MTVAVKPVFLDTNILVYASIDTSPFHTAARDALTQLESAETPLWISRQVMREYLATLVRPSIPLPVAELVGAVRSFELRYHVAEDSPLVTAQFLSLLEQGLSRQVHDTNIVATMLTYGVQRILTNNPNDFTPFQSLITVVPLT